MTAKNKFVVSFSTYGEDGTKQVLIEADRYLFNSRDNTAEFTVGEETVASFTNVNFVLKSVEQNGSEE